ncbi:MAG: helix-turn-helix domain-containing protein [Streptosporangiales bacterium]|nr:helix-turn-helix domain-containing protein [Streptosporangiales bacterium]
MPAGLTDRQAKVWAAVAAGRSTPADIGADLELAKSQTYKLLAELTETGYVRRTAKGRYTVTK